MTLLLFIEFILISSGVFLIRFKNKMAYIGLFAITLFFSIPDLYFLPYNTDDLYRYFQEMRIVQPCNSIKSLIILYKDTPLIANHSTNYIYDIFQWVIARSDNFSLLAFFSIFISYTCIFVPFVHQQINNKYHYNDIFIGMAIVLSLFPYFNTSSTVRWALASSILFLLLYITFNFRNSILILPLYFIPLFIHQGTIIPIIIIILCVFTKRIHIHWYMYLLFSLVMIMILYIISKSNVSGVSSLSYHFRYYNNIRFSGFFGGSLYAEISFWLMLLCSYGYCLLGALLIKDNDRYINLNNESRLLILFTIVDLLFIFDLTISGRYCLFIGLSVALIYLKIRKCNGVISSKIKYAFLIISLSYIFFAILYIVFKMNFDFSQINYYGRFIQTQIFNN